jgi:hypothetical protein
MTSRFALTALLLAALGAPLAHAGPPAKEGDRRAIAAAMFQQGIEDMQAGKTEQGCAKLAESVATMPDSGAMGALAECDTALGRLSEAWELWRDLSTSAPTAELRDDAAKNAAALDKRLARVAIHLRGDAPSDMVVTLNDKPVGAVDSEHRVVPGKLVVVAVAPDIERWAKTFDAKPGATIEVEIPLVASRSAVRKRAAGRVVAWSFMGFGTVAVITGVVFGYRASSNWDDAKLLCGGNTDNCNSAGFLQAQSKLADARHDASIASWTTAAGLVAIAAGVVVYVQYRSPRTAESATAWRVSPTAGPQTVGIVLTRGLP